MSDRRYTFTTRDKHEMQQRIVDAYNQGAIDDEELVLLLDKDQELSEDNVQRVVRLLQRLGILRRTK